MWYVWKNDLYNAGICLGVALVLLGVGWLARRYTGAPRLKIRADDQYLADLEPGVYRTRTEPDLGKLEPGQIVAYYQPGSEELTAGYVFATQGQKLENRAGGEVYVDGKRLLVAGGDAAFTSKKIPPAVIPYGSVLVVNSLRSDRDSRAFGPIRQVYLVGPVIGGKSAAR